MADREPFPVTDPLWDAPDGAIVDGFVRHGDTWYPTDQPDGYEAVPGD